MHFTVTTVVKAAVISAGLLGFVAACAEKTRTSWENPNLPWEQWRVDQAECRKAAEERAERDFSLRQMESAPPSAYSRNEPVVSSLNRFDAQRQIDRLFANCMTDRGYKQVERSAEE
ncbi:MAG: hypothetical protein JNM75_12845 [Rhodospirillales bacterium]|nr:hypothetical protein [Rhodospirillales bacterium]